MKLTVSELDQIITENSQPKQSQALEQIHLPASSPSLFFLHCRSKSSKKAHSHHTDCNTEWTTFIKYIMQNFVWRMLKIESGNVCLTDGIKLLNASFMMNWKLGGYQI